MMPEVPLRCDGRGAKHHDEQECRDDNANESSTDHIPSVRRWQWLPSKDEPGRDEPGCLRELTVSCLLAQLSLPSERLLTQRTEVVSDAWRTNAGR
jgi:hypothetical protein